MRPYEGYKPEMAAGSRAILPKGGYVARILNAKAEQTRSGGDMLVLAFDICEGEYTDFFKHDFEASTQDGKRWRGTFRISWPVDPVPQEMEWQVRAANDALGAIEASNSGYSFAGANFVEQTLKGKLVGVLFRNKEWEYNGRTGWTTECCKLTSVDIIHEGRFKIPADKPLKGRRINGTMTAGRAVEVHYEDPESEKDLPF